MAKRHLLPLFVALLLGFSIGFISARYYPVPKSQTQKTDLLLPYQTITTKNIKVQEQKQIKDFVATFYGYLYEKDVTKLLALFTPPSNKQEQDDLDFILGEDLARISAKLQTRLFTTQGYNYNVGGYYIRNIARHNDVTTVLVDEMRTMYSGSEYVGFITNVTNIIFEINQSKSGQKIVKYYHLHTNSDVLKYKGFEAN